MNNQLLDNDQQLVYFIKVGDKKFGPYHSELLAQSQIQLLQLTEQEKMVAEVIPSTPDGNQLLLG